MFVRPVNIATPEWFLFCTLSSLVAIPIIRKFSRKGTYLAGIMSFFYMLFAGGAFFAMIVCAGIVPFILSAIGLFLKIDFKSFFNGSFWMVYFLCCYIVWYLFSLIFTIKMLKGGSSDTGV
jgi:hypothetical protein